MSTRGVYGFRKNNTDKITYNHYDSYPSGLGNVILKFIQGTPLESLNFICGEAMLG